MNSILAEKWAEELRKLISVEPKPYWPGADKFEKELEDCMGYQDGGEEIYAE